MRRTMLRAAGWVLMLAGVVICRTAWESHPGVASCLSYWFSVLLLDVLVVRSMTSTIHGRVAGTLLILAGLCNATVTIANGGYMPVVGGTITGGTSVWVDATPDHNLLWLADQRAWAGCSIGDFLLVAYVLAVWFGGLVEAGARRVFGGRPWLAYWEPTS